MTTFLFIRHGLTDAVGTSIVSWLPGVSLNDRGRTEAEDLARRLEHAPIAALYSSPLERTMETAAPAAKALRLEIQVREAFGEVRFGDFSGKRLDALELSPEWKRYNQFRSGTRAPNGELMLEVQVRMVAELERLRAEHPDKLIAIFSHADAIRATLAHYTGIPLDLLYRIEISPASVTAIEIADWGPRVLLVNHTGELPFVTPGQAVL